MKKKSFVKTDLSIVDVPRSQGTDGRIQIDPGSYPPPSTRVRFVASSGHHSFDFAPWYGVQIDEITFACQRQVERFLLKQDHTLTHQTIKSYTTLGLKDFLEYAEFIAAGTEKRLTLSDIDRSFIDGFLVALAAGNLEKISQKTLYGGAKAILSALGRRGLLTLIDEGDDATFPRNPFPGIWNVSRGEAPLKRAERKAFTAALKTAVAPIFQTDTELTGELAAYALFAVALHTGRNTTPLLEMPVDCFRKHPREDLTFLILYKRRAHRWQKATLKGAQGEAPSKNAELPTAHKNVVRLIERVLELNAALRPEAGDLAERVWIYRGRRRGRQYAEVRVLTNTTLQIHINKLVRDYNLRDDQERFLRINVSRLRKTFINRVNEILGRDLTLTAVAAGNTPSVAATYYLRPGEDAEKNWSFLGTALVDELLANNIGATERTPTGRCTDPLLGQYAPRRDGAICTSFLNCLRCRNYVVTGDDLYRLFSFYWRVLEERSRIEKRRWRQHFAHIPRLIERDVIASGLERRIFTRSQVAAARERARVERHPFWATDTVIGTLEGLA